MTLTDLYNLAQLAGFSSSDALTAAAIALAESAGNPNVTGDNGDSIGLWQIDLRYHPEFSSWTLTDPATNAQAAYQVWLKAGGSFSPWTTYGSGAYKTFLPSLPLPGSTTSFPSGPLPGPTVSTAALTGPPSALDWTPWAWGLGGLVAFLLLRDAVS